MALLPIAVFIILFVGSGLLTGDFYLMPTTLAFLLSINPVALSAYKIWYFETKLYRGSPSGAR